MAELGLLTGEQEKQFGQVLDNVVDFTKFDGFVFKILEMLDGKIFSAAISYLDNSLADKIKPDIKPLATDFVLAVIAEDFDPDLVIATGTELLNILIDIPNVTEEYEAVMITGLLQIAVSAILNFLEKETEEPVEETEENE